jgi:hypothetical protein
VKTQKLPILVFVVGVIAATAVAAGGPILWAIAVMGIPFIGLFFILGGVAHGHLDNGHFRRPDEKA